MTLDPFSLRGGFSIIRTTGTLSLIVLRKISVVTWRKWVTISSLARQAKPVAEENVADGCKSLSLISVASNYVSNLPGVALNEPGWDWSRR